MRYLKHRRLHVNMGNYEHVEISATCEVDTVADKDTLVAMEIETPEQIAEFIDTKLELLLGPDLEDAAVYTAEEDSFVLPYEKDRQRKSRKKNG